MSCRMSLMGGIALVVSAMSVPAFSADSPHAAHMLKCASVCAACQVECDACFHHCATLVTGGQKDHAESMHLCVDCATCCHMCAALCGRQSHLSGPAAECCATCCETCAAACEKFPDDAKMAACAKSCRTCAQSCRDMVKMMK